jgi:molybdopterin/thiamine biosynthesis adenylyltransferase/rhodanese-related sulfurtransferase
MAERASFEGVTANTLTARELRRYSRHLLIPEVGLAGQERLAHSRVLVIGAGGLGSPALQYLAASGVGRIGIIDDDVVDETNLQRQTIFSIADVGRPKAEVAAERVHALNPSVAVDALKLRYDETNARALVAIYDIVLDCTDRFPTRYLINDACVLEGKPDVYASIFRFDGQVSIFARHGPCYRCLYPEPPPAGSVPTCAEGGVLGVLAGIVGAFQANEALKLLLGIGDPLVGRLMLVDALGARIREVCFDRDPACVLCGAAPRLFDAREITYGVDAEVAADEVDPAQLDELLRDHVLLDVREPHEIVLGMIEGGLHIPASNLEERLHELDSAKQYVVACRVGQKSRWAAQRLKDAGFTRVRHLRGGLLAYATYNEDFGIF